MKFIREVGGFVGGALAAGVAGITLYNAVTNTTISTIDDVVGSLEKIAISISENGVSPESREQTERALAALGGVSQALAETADNSGESGSYLRVFDGVFDLPESSAVDLDTPNGEFATFGFHRFKRGSDTWAGVYFNGEEQNMLPGQIIKFPENEDICQIMYVGPVDAEEQAARFRFRCRQ